MASFGLSEAEAERRLAERPPPEGAASRSYRSIVRENTLTLFNLILGSFAVALAATGQFADMTFALVAAVNIAIGVVQEVRAKRTLDRLALLVAPHARVVRDGAERSVAVAQVAPGDAIRIAPGEQVVADGALVEARGLQLDESALTGEADAVSRRVGEEVRSGCYCVAGAGTYVAEHVGDDAYASRLAGVARSDRQPLSPLQLAINRLLRVLVAVMLPLAAVFVLALRYHQIPLHQAVATATAGIVSLVPEGLVLLTSLTFALAAARMARRGALVQRLNAIESLAGVEVVCVDKTGTLTDGTLSVDELVPLAGDGAERLAGRLGAFAASLAARNPTAEAIAAYASAPAESVSAEVPFSSRWKWSGLSYADGRGEVLGAPEALAAAAGLDEAALREIERRAREQKRVLVFAAAEQALHEPVDDALPSLPPLQPLGLVVLGERMRPDAAETVAFLAAEGVAVKVISGDSPTTVEAVARAAGLETHGRVVGGDDIPDDDVRIEEAAQRNTVFARVRPEQKRALVEALRRRGSRVAMIGDGVNDVAALKAADVAVALGSGSQIAKGVSDLVLVSLDFAAIPASIEAGRRILRNIQRVAKLFVTKSVFAAVLILTVGIGGGTYPFLPRQLSLAATLTVGIPGFALALAPSTPERPRGGFLREVSTFAIPAGTATAVAVLLGYGLVHANLGRSAAQSQTTSLTILVAVGLYIVLVLEAGAMRRSAWRARGVPALVGALAASYLLILAWPPARTFFGLAAPSFLPALIACICTVVAIGVLGALGLSLTRPGGERPDLRWPWREGA